MQGQVNGTVGLATLETAQPLGWRAAATEEYERSRPIRHADLSTKILALTGRRISSQEIYTDGYLAVAGVDGATFRLYHGGHLVLVRVCAYCATGHFESPQMATLSDLGCALTAWRPLHEDCEDYSSEELPAF
jgi:hypothetical protein